jgi:hypothetical protein
MNDKTEPSLPAEAEVAWLAYQAMGESKKIYFAFLQELDQKYDKNQSPSIAENLKLEELLKTHDVNVKAFNEAMANVEEPGAREAIMNKLTSASTLASSH